MARVLAISSQVARGAVGLSIVVPALHALGHEVIALPTVILSNHPGHRTSSCFAVEPDQLGAMLDALDANGWLDRLDGVLSGYLPTAAHAEFAVDAIGKVRSRQGGRQVIYLCDPILGDYPKGLYIDARAASAIRDRLLPLADMITPNRFELSWLSNSMPDADADGAAAAAKWTRLAPLDVVATSMPDADPRHMRNIAHGRGIRVEARVRERTGAPHGTGDLFAALLLAARLEGRTLAGALASATAGVDQVLAASAGCDTLANAALPRALTTLPAWPIEQRNGPEHAEPHS